MSKILVCMAAFNEAKYIYDLIIECKKYADEIIVLNDGSSDGTEIEAKKAGAVVISHETNMGKGVAIQNLFKEARKRNFDVMVMLDSDGQHLSSDIDKVAQPILDGYDVVIGYRTKSEIPTYRYVGQQVLSKFTGLLAEAEVDSQSGFRAYSPKAVSNLFPKEKRMAVESELVSLATQLNLKMTQVPITVKYHDDGSTYNPVAQGVATIMRIIVMISERRPLLFFGVGGIIITLLGVLLGIKAYFMLNQGGALPVGTAMVSLLLMVNGAASTFAGVILNVVGKLKK